ncbi:MAG: DUF123 domain-containing protein [Halobacteriaceae archaeon]
MGGTYTLLVEMAADATIEVGALGARAFDRGWYAYTGSALGAGGFGRVERHREVARGERDVRHWHVDYLLGHPAASIDGVVAVPADVECMVARHIAEATRPVPGFGASDCNCDTHLAAADDREPLAAAVRRAHAATR